MSLSNENEELRSIVYKFSTATQQNISPTVLLNILSETCSFFNSKNNGSSAESHQDITSNIQVQLDNISTAIKTIQNNIGLLSNSCDENVSKIQNLETKVNEMEKSMNLSVNKFQSKIDDAISTFNARVNSLEKLTVVSLLKANERERRDRVFSCKFHAYYDSQLVDNNGKPRPANISDIFTRIVKPALTDAKANGEVDWIPETWGQCIERGHPLQARPGLPPNFILRFRSRTEMFGMLHHKDKYIELLNQQNKTADKTYAQAIIDGKIPRCRVGVNLTLLDKDVLTWLCSHREVSRAYLRGDRIVFSLHSKPKFFFTVLNPFGSNLRELCQPAADQMPFLMSTFPLSPFLQPDTPGTFNPRRKLVLDQPETTQNPLLLEDYENGDIHVPETPQQHYQALNKTTSQNSPGLHPQQRAQHRLSQVRQYRNYNKRATYHPPANRQRPHHNQQTQDLPADVRDDITRPSPTKILNRSFGPLVSEISKQSAALSSTVGFAYIEESACLNQAAEDVCNISNQISSLRYR